MAYTQATRKQLSTKALDENTFCDKMNSSGYICEKCSKLEDKNGKDFKFKRPEDKEWKYVDVKGFKSFRKVFGTDKDNTFIETYYNLNNNSLGWVCHDWYTAFKVTDEYNYAIVHNSLLRKLLKEKAAKDADKVNLDDVKDAYEIKNYYPYIRNSSDKTGEVKSVIYWVPLKDITSLDGVVFI